ncbi:MAG: phosphotransferase [Actinobacteria bacterium]|nr:phosphotransferase [Actinomycetota bacterium]
MARLTEEDIIGYLTDNGVLDPYEQIEVIRCSGGYVNVVFRVNRRAGNDLVVKQSFEKSQRTVLRADIGRAAYEVYTMRTLKQFVGLDCPTPWVIHHDPREHLVVMAAAPRHAVLYDDELLAGRVMPGIGRQLGTYVGRLHEKTKGIDKLATLFRHNPGFALREQSIRSVVKRHPDLTPAVEAALRRNVGNAHALVDADTTPKNVLLHDGTITKLDFECAQWGDPALDLGIVIAHYALHAIAGPAAAQQVLAEAAACYEAYQAIFSMAASQEYMQAVARYAALMMLGRSDGDLVFEYLVPYRRQINKAARAMLAWDTVTMTDLHSFLTGETRLQQEGA